jgi:transposase
MYKVEMYLRVRRACFVEGMSAREAGRVYGLHRDTVRKMLKYSVPPGYRRKQAPSRPKLDPYKGVIDQILEMNGDNYRLKHSRQTNQHQVVN